MSSVAVGFWGAYFGTIALLVAGSIAAFAKSLHRVALTAALFALISATYFAAYIGLLPLGEPQTRWRWLAHISVLSAAVLGMMVLAMLGVMRNPARARMVRVSVALAAALLIGAGWMVGPQQSLTLSSVVTMGMAFAMLYLCIRSAERGDRLAWWAVTGVSFMIAAIAGLGWIAHEPEAAPVWVHATSAVAGMAYVSVMATALWIRYSYLIELREVVTHGPSYDPITRMRTHSETGQMVGLAFFGQDRDDARPVGVVAVTIGNLYTLEKLHGRAAVNHALFVCASRLRRTVPATVEMGRLGDDGFLLLVRRGADRRQLGELGRTVAERLARPVSLATSGALPDLEAGKAHWEAQVGVGLLLSSAEVRPSEAITKARSMSRAAWSYSSRVACQREGSSEIVELADSAFA